MDKVYFQTSDGNIFYTENAALNHARTLADKRVSPISGDRRQMTDDGQQTTDDRRRTMDDGQQMTDHGLQVTDDEPQKIDGKAVVEKTINDGQHVEENDKNSGQPSVVSGQKSKPKSKAKPKTKK